MQKQTFKKYITNTYSKQPLLQLIARAGDRLAVFLTHLTFSSVQYARSTPFVPAESP